MFSVCSAGSVVEFGVFVHRLFDCSTDGKNKAHVGI